MKIKTLVITLLLGSLIQSCGNSMNTPITEELNIETLRKNMENNPNFEDFYEFAMEKRNIVMSSSINQAKWGEITYRELKEAYDCNNPFESDKWTKIWDEWDEDYLKLMKKYSSQTDSIFDYWKCYKKENGLDNYAKIEFIDIYREDSQVKAKFKVIPLKEELTTLCFKFRFFRKKSTKDKTKLQRRFYEGDLTSFFLSEDNIITRELPDFKYADDSDIDLDNLKNNFVLKTCIYYVKENESSGIDFEAAIPKEIREYIAFDDEYAKELCSDKVISKYIDTDFPDRWLYRDMRIGEALNDINPKLLDLIDYSE